MKAEVIGGGRVRPFETGAKYATYNSLGIRTINPSGNLHWWAMWNLWVSLELPLFLYSKLLNSALPFKVWRVLCINFFQPSHLLLSPPSYHHRQYHPNSLLVCFSTSLLLQLFHWLNRCHPFPPGSPFSHWRLFTELVTHHLAHFFREIVGLKLSVNAQEPTYGPTH